jgi:putative ABC transport system permease protein
MSNLFRRMFYRSSLDEGVREELESHLAMRAEQNQRSGMSEKEALAAARRQFGNPTFIREQIYEFNSFSFLDAVGKDLRYAFRGLRRNFGLSLTVVLTIAIGVGTVTGMFGLMRNLMLAPPPHVTMPDRVFRLHQWFPGEKQGESSVGDRTSYPFYELLANRAKSIEAVAAYNAGDMAAGAGARARMTHAVMVSAGFWRTLKTQPKLGRFIADNEAHPATGSRVVVLSYGFWKREFGGSADAIGRTLKIKGQPYEIIGVTPRGFRGIELADVDLWLPLFASDDGSGHAVTWHIQKQSYTMKIVLRLKTGTTVQRAGEELTSLQRAFLVDAYSMIGFSDRDRIMEQYRRARVLFGPLTGGLGDDLRPVPEARVTVWLVGVACALLAIACSNVAGLLLLRAMQRRREIAVRLALGAGWGRLARQFLTETTLLALLGGLVAGIAIALGGALVQRIILPSLAWDPVAVIDTRVLAVAGACIICTALAAGMAPICYARSGIMTALHEGSPTGSGRRFRMQAVLLAIQGALSVVLLVGAGLFVRSLHNANTVDIGLDRDNVLAVQIDFSGTGRTRAGEAAFFESALERVSTIQGVAHASLASNIPLRSYVSGFFQLPGSHDLPQLPTHEAPFVNAVTPGFFATTGMRIREGREFLEHERNSGDAIVVNETLARLYWPGRSPIGECVYSEKPGKCATVVGVVADTHMFTIIEDRPHLNWYRPLGVREELSYPFPRALMVRMAPGIRRLDSTIRQALYGVDSELPHIKIETLGEALDPQIRSWRLGASVFTAFGVFALILAMIGLWSSVAYAVSQRRHEFAIRLAVGANRLSLIGMVLKQSMRVSLVAIATGLVIAYLGSRFIADLLYRVSPHDPLVFVSVTAGTFIIATLASLAPACRANRIKPAQSLRAD